jgi:hypothetical protein
LALYIDDLLGLGMPSRSTRRWWVLFIIIVRPSVPCVDSSREDPTQT